MTIQNISDIFHQNRQSEMEKCLNGTRPFSSGLQLLTEIKLMAIIEQRDMATYIINISDVSEDSGFVPSFFIYQVTDLSHFVSEPFLSKPFSQIMT